MIAQADVIVCERCGDPRSRDSKRLCRPCLNKAISESRKIWYCVDCKRETARRNKRCAECNRAWRVGRSTYERTPENNTLMSNVTRGKPKPWLRGSKHHNYKGGNSPERQRLYMSGEGRAFLRAIYHRDDYKCTRCGSPKIEDKGLHAHHILSWAEYPETRFDPANVVTLCRGCHSWVHSNANAEGAYL